ncbi:MAG: hypothetical protein WCI17_10175, partial [bacterium]
MKNQKIPAWMRSGRPDTIFKNCINVQEGLVEACDFDPAMCQPCETTTCKWHPTRLAKGGPVEDLDEEEDDDGADDEDADEDSDHESAAGQDDDD